MSSTLAWSSVAITLALVFYSVGVWAERIQRYLKPWHLAAFWTGLVFDVTGTFGMSLLSQRFDPTDFHTITGQLAIWLMFAHAVWASFVVRRDNQRLRRVFHRFSLFVWLVWLVPYFGGMFAGMGRFA
ncbi:MAG: HsmA family protein [Coriobacteriia bacterium]